MYMTVSLVPACDTPLPALPQWVVTLTSRPADVWGPCPPSDVTPGGETPQGPSPTGGSVPTSQTQTGAPLAPPPHITSPQFSYTIPPFPISLSAIPIFPVPSIGSIPPPANCCQWTTMPVPSTGTKRPPSVVSYTPIIPAPYVPLSPQLATSFASSPSRAGTLLKLGVTN